MYKNTKENGQNDEAKRRDPLTPSQVRYQTAPHPDAKQLADHGVLNRVPGV